MSHNRLKTFKNYGKDTDELRRRRTDQVVELRKARKDEQIAKRRNIEIDQTSQVVAINDATLQQIVQDMFSNDRERQLTATELTRKILSRDVSEITSTTIDIVIQAGIVPRCSQFLANHEDSDLQFEAAWVLTNIASGIQTQTYDVVNAGAVEPFIELLRSPHNHIAEQAVWALGNIAGDGPALRDFVIIKGIVPPLVALAKSTTSVSFLRNIAWTLQNLCRVKRPSPPPPEDIRMCLPALARLIKIGDMEVVSDACWALSSLSEGSNEKIEDVVKAGVVPRLVELLDCGNYNVVFPSLRTVGNIVSGTDLQTHCVVKSGALPLLAKLLGSEKNNIVKEAAWTVSNIAAGTADQITEILQAGIVPLLVNVLKSGEFRAQKEAVWAITNISSGGNVNNIIHLCQNGVIPAMCDMLKCTDWRTILTTLDCLENVLKAANEVKQVDKVACAIEECGGVDLIEQLQDHENDTVYNKALSIIETFFSEETPDCDDFEMSVPNVPDGGFNL